MKRNPAILITVSAYLLLGLCIQSVNATGSTHIWGPSTDIQGFNLWHLTTDVYIAAEGDRAGNRIAPVTNLGLTVGILPFEKFGMEIGFDHKSGLGAADDYPLYRNIKIGLPENAFGSWFPAIAMGAYDIGTRSDVTDYNILYAKIAKSVTVGKLDLGRLSLGYFTGNDELLIDAKGEADENGLMAAWERTMSELSDRLWICVEYMGTESTYGTLNVGAAWKVAPNVGVLAGYSIYNNASLADTFTLQIDIDF